MCVLAIWDQGVLGKKMEHAKYYSVLSQQANTFTFLFIDVNTHTLTHSNTHYTQNPQTQYLFNRKKLLLCFMFEKFTVDANASTAFTPHAEQGPGIMHSQLL